MRELSISYSIRLLHTNQGCQDIMRARIRNWVQVLNFQ
jgi:hypothetical protein